MERKVVDRIALINKLNGMSYKEISEAQMRHIFTTLGYTIEIEEEVEADAVQADSGESERPTESD